MNEQDIRKIAQKISEQFRCEVNETVNTDIIPTDVVFTGCEVSNVEYNESENILKFTANGSLKFTSHILFDTRDAYEFTEDAYDSFFDEVYDNSNGEKRLNASDLFDSAEKHLTSGDEMLCYYPNESPKLTFSYQLEETNNAIIAECIEAFKGDGSLVDVYLGIHFESGLVLQAGPHLDETVQNILSDLGVSNSKLTGDKLVEGILNSREHIDDTLFYGEVLDSIEKAINDNAQVKRVVLEKE